MTRRTCISLAALSLATRSLRAAATPFTLGVCRNEKGDMRFGNRVIRIGEAVAGHFSTTERGERRDRG